MKHAKQAKDLVCGMMVDIDASAISATHQGKVYYFCATACRTEFIANPQMYVGTAPAADEPSHTSWGGFEAPKFGSAGSGGAEYEPGPAKAGKRSG